MIVRLSWLVPIVVLGLLTTGCGKSGRAEVQKVPVSGAVTQDGKPMATGKVVFKNDQTSTTDVVEIKDGKFSGEATPGTTRVEVVLKRETKEAKPVGGMEPATITEELIAPEFNIKTTLTATITEAGPNEFTFAVKSK